MLSGFHIKQTEMAEECFEIIVDQIYNLIKMKRYLISILI